MQTPSAFETLKSFELGIQKSEWHKIRVFILTLGECTAVIAFKSMEKDST